MNAMHLIYFETSATRYSVAATRVVDKPDLLLYGFGLCGMPMTAALWAIDHEPYSFDDFSDAFGRREMSVTDVWVGFMVLRHLLGYAIAFDQLPGFLQREALTHTVEAYQSQDADDDTLIMRAWLADEVGRWPVGWQQQLQPMRDDLGLALHIR